MKGATVLSEGMHEIIGIIADEVLNVLKNDRLNEEEKKNATEHILGTLTEERFTLLVNLGEKIINFGSDERNTTNDENIDEEGYAIFEEISEEDDEDVYGEVRSENDSEGDEGEEANDDRIIHAENVSFCSIILFKYGFPKRIIIRFILFHL